MTFPSSLRGVKPGRVAQLVEHSTLNRLVVGSIPTASTTFIPIFQALTVTGSFAPTMRFPKPDQKPDQTFFADCAGLLQPAVVPVPGAYTAPSTSGRRAPLPCLLRS